MNYEDWYTDKVDVFRMVEAIDGNLTRNQREQVAAAIPCRVYQRNLSGLRMKDTAAEVQGDGKLACDLAADIQTGDELWLHCGAATGAKRTERGFAGAVLDYDEPFGAVIPGLAHKEVHLTQRKRVE